jgi:hypothetical protein
VAKLQIELVHRGSGVIVPLHPTDPLTTEEKPQRRLAELYRVYDLKCCCVEGGVMMHIRQIEKLSLYYVADNPTSPMHSEQCALGTSRLGISQSDAKDYIPGPITEFTLIHRQSASEPQSSKARKRSPNTPPHMRQSYLLMLTLIRNAFLNLSFGRYRSLQDFAKSIMNSEQKIPLNPSLGGLTTVNELLSFGPGGLKIAKNRAAIHGCAFWLSYSTDIHCSPTSITIYDSEHKTRITRPYIAEGAHILFSIVNKDGLLKEVVVQPVVSGTYVLPIFSSNDREIDIKGELQNVFKANNSGLKHKQWISVDLWGGDNNPGAIYHVEKLPSGNRTCRLINH